MIYFIRHGQTDWNILSKCQGRKDISLNKTGINQAKSIYYDLINTKIDKFYCSPLLRTRQTFKYAFGRDPNNDEIDERIIERDFGEFEGLTRTEFDFNGFWDENSNQNFKKAESLFSVIKRANDLLNEINTKYINKNVVIISHGGFGIVFKSLIEGIPRDGSYLHIEMPHGSLITLDNEKYIKSQIADKEEMLLVLDENGNSTNKFEKRSIVHSQQLYHNEVALWIINGNQVLLEKRSPNKKQNPNKLALCAGHIVENETIEEALYKEAKEEIGLNLNNYDVKKLMVLKRTEKNNYCFSHHYYIKANIPIKDFITQKEEISEVIYKDFNYIVNETKNETGNLVFNWNNEYKSLFEMIDEIIKNQ